MRPDVEEFYQGISFDAYRLLGAHPAGPGRGWLFTLWAPHARRVQVLGDWNNWDLYSASELACFEDGLWRIRVPQAQTGQLYKYNIQGPDGGWQLKADPFAFAFEALPGTASRLAEPEFSFQAPLQRGARNREPVLIYELHAASWHRHWDGRYYTGPELAKDLVPYLVKHHYTHVEFMPLAEYPFDGSWGYQGCGYFAPTQRIGGFAGFAALVDALHAAGIAVLMDFVPVHFVADSDRLALFDGTSLFECGPSDWGSLNFDFSKPPVRSFLLSSAAFWLQVCHCDGLRVDAIDNALTRTTDSWQAAEFFKTLTAGLHARFPGCVLVAENSTADISATAATSCGGLGFDYVWHTGWAQDALACLSAPFDQRAALLRQWCADLGNFVAAQCIHALSHDESAPVSVFSRLYGTTPQKFDQLCLLLLLQAAWPGKSLLFAGVEFAQPDAFSDGREPDWSVLAEDDHRAMDEYVQALNAFCLAHPAMYAPEDAFRAAQVPESGVFGFVLNAGSEMLLCAANTGIQPAHSFAFSLPSGHQAIPLFATGWADDTPRPVANGCLRLSLAPLRGEIWKII